MSQGSAKNMEWRLKLMNSFKKRSTILGLSAVIATIFQGISQTFEPGSAISPLIACAGLEEGKVTPDSIVNDDPVTVSGYTIHCWKGNKGHGKETFSNAIENSCNPVFVNLVQNLGSDKFYKYLKNFGLYDKTGIELNGEVSGSFTTNPNKNDLVAASVGAHFGITPLQLLSAYGAIANEGRSIKPHIINGISDESISRTVISSQTANIMKEILESKVSDGTARNAYVSDLRIAGSTGTVQNTNGQFTALFVGFAPADNPKFACIVILDGLDANNDTPPSGAMTAAPLAGKIFKAVGKYINIY